MKNKEECRCDEANIEDWNGYHCRCGKVNTLEGTSQKCKLENCSVCHAPQTNKEEGANYVHVGETIECGHCQPIKGYKLVEEYGLTCECKCHKEECGHCSPNKYNGSPIPDSNCKCRSLHSPQTPDSMDWEKEFVEKGAELEHVRWAKWQNYLHSFLVWNNDIQMWTLPHEKKEWWDSEISTPYSMLNEGQKESDRKEVRTYLPLIRNIIALAHSSGRREAINEVRELLRNYPKQLIELNHGKLPWVIWEGKVDEEERIKIFMHAFEEAFKTLSLLDKDLT